jgi:hypothetical protein
MPPELLESLAQFIQRTCAFRFSHAVPSPGVRRAVLLERETARATNSVSPNGSIVGSGARDQIGISDERIGGQR